MENDTDFYVAKIVIFIYMKHITAAGVCESWLRQIYRDTAGIQPATDMRSLEVCDLHRVNNFVMLVFVKLVKEERSGFLPVVYVYEFCHVNTYNDTKR